MIRAGFFTCGLFVTLCGVVLLFVDRVVLTDYAGKKLREAAKQDSSAWRLVYSVDGGGEPTGAEVVDPPDWGGVCLASVGGVTLLYSLCLPGRKPDDEEDEG